MLEDDPLANVRDFSFKIFATTLHIVGRLRHSPCRADEDQLITE